MNQIRQKHNFRQYSIFIFSSIIFVVMAVFMWSYSIDDAFITFRYAEHLADGHGLVFNIGEEPVEGYSNFLWLLILSGLYKIGLDTLVSAKVLGLMSFMVSAFLWFRYFRGIKSNLLWLAAPFFLIFPVTVFWGVSGLELGLHTLIVSLVLISLFGNSNYIYLWLPLLVISRPEGPAIAFIIIGTAFIIDLINKKVDKKYYLISFFIIVTATLALILFRMSWFGYPLPNTYYAKSHHNPALGFIQTGRMFMEIAPYVIAFISGLVLLIIRRLSDKKMVVLATIFLAQLIISAGVDPIMNFKLRYLIPFMLPLIAVSLYAVSFIKTNPLKYAVILILAGSLFIPIYHIILRINLEKDIWLSQKNFISWAKPLAPETTISMTDMGRIPYYADKKYNDIWGLLNKDIGQLGYNPYKEFQRLPDYFVLVGYIESNSVKLRFWREQKIGYHKVFHQAYELKNICKPENVNPAIPGYYYLIFQRKPEAFDILSRIKQTG